MLDRFLRRKEVEAATGLSKPTIYRQMGEGTFPKPKVIGLRAVAWRESDISAWQSGKRNWQLAA